MLEEAAHDGADVHVVGLAGSAGQQAGDATDDHLHLHAGARCLRDLVDNLAVGERVELKEHAGGLAGKGALDLAVQATHDHGFKAGGRHAQEAVVAAQVAQRQVAEEQVRVLANAGVGGHEHKVRVELGGLLVKVARAKQRQARERHALAVGDLADLGVALKALGAVDNGATGLFQALGPLDVVLLVKAGAQLHKDGDLFAVLHGVDERLAQAALLGHAVKRDANGDAVLVKGGLVYQIEERPHGLVGVGEELVALQHLLAHGAAGVDGGAGLRLERREHQRLAGVLGDMPLDAKDVAQIERDVEHRDRALRKLERLADGLEGGARKLARDGKGHGLQTQTLLEDALHVQTVVFFFLNAFAVGVDVGVAGHADHSAVERRVAAKATVKARANHVLQQDVAVLAHAVRHLDHAAHRGRNLDQAQQVLLVCALDGADQVQAAVAQVGEGVTRVDHERRDDGRDVRAEVPLHKGALVAVERLGVRAVDAVAFERGFDTVERILGAVDHGRQGLKHTVDLLGRREVALVVHGLALERRQVGEAADAHHEELDQVALEDRDELHALKQRDRLVKGLVEYAPVKAEPGELAVLGVGKVVALAARDLYDAALLRFALLALRHASSLWVICLVLCALAQPQHYRGLGARVRRTCNC